jgi:hypothetical protein
MAFDINDPADKLALKNEVNNDPLSLGYNPDANVNTLLGLLNDASKNTGGETANQKLTPRILLAQVVLSDYDSNQVTDGERRYIEAFFNRQNLDEEIEEFRDKIRDAFKINSTTVTNIDALVRPLSRAEVLFGSETVISKADWIAARNS